MQDVGLPGRPPRYAGLSCKNTLFRELTVWLISTSSRLKNQTSGSRLRCSRRAMHRNRIGSYTEGLPV